ncbi:MAG: threonine aldolase family protein [Pirellulales bacterium]|jgi:threonine aldolase
MTALRRGFASDNRAGPLPEVLAAVAAVSGGHAVSYGGDDVTAALGEAVRREFGPRAEAFPMFNGTGANVVALAALTRGRAGVICTDLAHVHTDEGGAPEALAGLKLWTVPTPDGKLTPAAVETQAWGFDDVHRAKPAVVTITQSTEMGTVYTPAEIAALATQAHGHGMKFHIDGARLANAAAALGVSFAELTSAAGVDAVTFGATKNGALAAEAVIVFDPETADAVRRLRKTHGQLPSKMRFVSAQILALLTDGLWRRPAAHANAMASRLAAAVRGIPGVTITQPVQANAVFVILPPEASARLQARHGFYTWNPATREVRWMCSWDTTPEDVDEFAADVARELGR